jgi:predicted helicase
MPELRLRDSHKSIREYYRSLTQYSLLEATHEGAVKAAFCTLLAQCARQFEWTVLGEYELARARQRALRVDGAIVDRWKLARGYWEAKDEHDDLALEAKKKIALGYPTDNILFQAPERAILYQNGKRVLDESLTQPETLVDILKEFFRYEPPAFAEWERAVDDFGDHVPKLANALLELIEKERRENKKFLAAFEKFVEVCRASINPTLSEIAVEKMLVQHLLTERIFHRIFDNPDFARRNIIAIEIERVIDALVGRAFNRQKFLGVLDRFYVAIEKTAASISDYGEKQHFLNSIYERFFQRFDTKTADTHGIVYTPQPIVRFMVRSVDEVLQREFGRSIGARDVHVIDPFVGTGNFLVNVMRQIPKTQLEDKYAGELHANEVMLLPYYIASMNLEHEYTELTGEYKAFEGICFVDTFELAETQESLRFTEANAERVAKQKRSPIFAILGNPPYNAWQANDSDRNKNRKYAHVDKRVAETYGHDSRAQLTAALQDPYVKAFRWATDRLRGEGLIAYVTNSSFVDGVPFDGMRKHLGEDFDTIYVLDLGGNVRRNTRLSGTAHNVFGIQVGVAITICVRRSQRATNGARVWYARFDEDARREAKLKALDEYASISGVAWKEIEPDRNHTWLTLGNADEYQRCVPMAPKTAGAGASPGSIFSICSNGPKSQRDAIVWDFNRQRLLARMLEATRSYGQERRRYNEAGMPRDVDAFLDRSHVKWSDTLKMKFARGAQARVVQERARPGLWRPFTSQHIYLDDLWIDRPGQVARMFPTVETEAENMAIIAMSHSQVPFAVFATRVPACIDVCGRPSHVFPLFTYAADGTGRQENITDWSVAEFRKHYRDDSISKLDIFHYAYGVLHHPAYRTRYAENLKRELPRLPYSPSFRQLAEAGKRLLVLHVDYESQDEYPLRRVEMPGRKLDWRVEKMRITKDRQGIVVNDFLALAGIPPAAFEYKIGNRSALDWIIEQYQVATDRRSGVVSDPNRSDDPQYIVRLIGQVVTVSVETVKIVKALPALDGVASAAPALAKARGSRAAASSPPPPPKGPAKTMPRSPAKKRSRG